MDSALIAGIRRRDPAACREFVEAYGPRILKAARSLGFSAADAEEITADTLSEAVLSISRYRQRSSLFTWLYGILLNLCRVRRRRERRAVSGPPPSPEPESDLADMLPLAILRLSEDHREIILLRYFDGLPVDQIAVRLGIPAGTIKSRLHHGRLFLRKILKEMNLPHDPDTHTQRPPS